MEGSIKELSKYRFEKAQADFGITKNSKIILTFITFRYDESDRFLSKLF